MKGISRLAAASIVLSFCAGCATTDQALLELRNRNRDLTQQVADQDSTIRILKNDKDFLQTELAYYTKRATVLEKEKAYRIESSSDLRQGIREFTDNVINSLNTYYQKTEVVDYVGAELIQRAMLGDEKNQLLIDLAHPLASDSTLIGGRIYLSAPGRLVFCLLRQHKEDQYTVVRMSEPLSADQRGVQNPAFQVPLAGKKGDVIAVYFPEAVLAPYDDADTGNVLLVPGPVQVNQTIRLPPVEKRNKRTYSFGMTGYLNK